VLPKVQNVIWRLIKNGLPTSANRRYRHLTGDASCEMCCATSEDCYHVVMQCPHAKALRDVMREVWCLPMEEMLHNVGLKWLLAVLEAGKTEEVANLAMVLWRAWTVRNKVTRAGEVLPIVGFVDFLLNLANNLNEARGQERMNRVEVQGQGNNDIRK
jgi:hypothetical protein